jgi:cytochrome c553
VTEVRGTLAALLLAAAFLSAAAAQAGDPEAGREKAAACRACHGLDGLGRRPDAPNLAGQPALYLGEQLRAYRSGDRVHPVMNVVAADLSDQEIEDLSAWYSALKVEVVLPD